MFQQEMQIISSRKRSMCGLEEENLLSTLPLRWSRFSYSQRWRTHWNPHRTAPSHTAQNRRENVYTIYTASRPVTLVLLGIRFTNIVCFDCRAIQSSSFSSSRFFFKLCPKRSCSFLNLSQVSEMYCVKAVSCLLKIIFLFCSTITDLIFPIKT